MQSTDTVNSQEKRTKNIWIVIKLRCHTSLIKDDSLKKYEIRRIN